MKTTKKDFEKFKKFHKIWIKKFGLTGYRFYYEYKNDGKTYASTTTDNYGKVAMVCFNVKWDEKRKLDDYELERLALHEILHSLLANFYFLAGQRFTTAEEIEKIEEDTVRRIENMIIDSVSKEELGFLRKKY